ncbi:UNVERIFIED_CONTAM: hypothetical protein FKN15_024049 [Acipenser sinensis]
MTKKFRRLNAAAKRARHAATFRATASEDHAALGRLQAGPQAPGQSTGVAAARLVARWKNLASNGWISMHRCPESFDQGKERARRGYVFLGNQNLQNCLCFYVLLFFCSFRNVQILVVIEPLLIDEDYYARVEGREIISNLAKAAGLATMISTMRPDIDNMDEYVRNTTARAFAVVASALGIPSLLPFLKAVCKSKKSWQARHTGIKIVQQIAILMGCAILPHLRSLVEIIEHGLVDEQQKVRTISALAIAALAEAATPYGIESFDSVLKPLWKGIRQHRGKGLAAFLKAIGYLIPLMDAEYANYYTREVMLILIREFQSPDEEMKKIVLKVVKQCCGTDGVEANYIKTEILPAFFKHFWQHRMALDRRNYRQLVDTTVELANKVGAAEIISRIVDDLKDEAEQYRKMVMETIEKIMGNLGAADIDHKLEEQLIDGILYAFQEQTTEDSVMLNGFGTVVNALGKRVKPYLPQICGTVLWRLNNKSAKVRQQAADLISRTAVVMKTCQEDAKCF